MPQPFVALLVDNRVELWMFLVSWVLYAGRMVNKKRCQNFCSGKHFLTSWGSWSMDVTKPDCTYPWYKQTPVWNSHGIIWQGVCDCLCVVSSQYSPAHTIQPNLRHGSQLSEPLLRWWGPGRRLTGASLLKSGNAQGIWCGAYWTAWHAALP